LSWIKFLKKHIACAFSLVSSPQISSWSRDAQASREAFESQGILFPKRLSFHKGWCCGSQWKRIAELWRVVWVVGGSGFRRKWWVPFDSLVGRSLFGVVVGWLKVIHRTKISPVGYRAKPIFEDLMWFFFLLGCWYIIDFWLNGLARCAILPLDLITAVKPQKESNTKFLTNIKWMRTYHHKCAYRLLLVYLLVYC